MDRIDPYANFNFRVVLDGTVVGAFSVVSAFAKIKGLHKSSNVTLKRGLIGAATLRDWVDRRRKRSVSIELRTAPVRLTLTGARIVKHDADFLDAVGNDVAVGELVLSCDSVEVLSPADPGDTAAR
jgi:hypothetical protein